MTDTRGWGLRFAEEREACGLTQAELAERVGVKNYRTVLRWEKEEGAPERDTRARIAAVSDGFAALVAELPPTRQEQRVAADAHRAGLAASLAELEETVAGLKRTVESLRRRIVALEQRPPAAAPGTARGARRR